MSGGDYIARSELANGDSATRMDGVTRRQIGLSVLCALRCSAVKKLFTAEQRRTHRFDMHRVFPHVLFPLHSIRADLLKMPRE